MPDLPFSAAAERNKAPILAVLRKLLAGCREVLEIGSGTGQHAVHFAAALPALRWQPTELAEYQPALAARIAAEGPPNCLPAVVLDVRSGNWPGGKPDAVFTANTLHIMSWTAVQAFMSGVGRVLGPAGLLCTYGPFRYNGQFTTPSNAAFDASLRRRDPESGIRDIEALADLAGAAGLALTADHPMPANNQLLVWTRQAG